MVYGNIIVRKVEIKDFLDLIRDYKTEQIECTEHTFFRLSDAQGRYLNVKNLKNTYWMRNRFWLEYKKMEITLFFTNTRRRL